MAVVKNLMVRAGADFSNLAKSMQSAQKSSEQFQKKMSSTFKMLGAAIAAAVSVQAIRDTINMANEQIMVETKLAVVMRQRMQATEEMIQSIKNLTAEQQGLGIIGDEVQLAGAQQLATFLNTTDSLKTLIPAMNNLAAQQFGVKATSENLVNVGNMIGKVMNGQVGALKRVGISFTAAEEQALKFGNEQERAAALAQVITNNVGQMNAALANTTAGRMQQVANAFGDMKEEIGKAFLPLVDLMIPALMSAISLATRFAQKMQMAMAVVSAFVRALFGMKSQTKETTQQAQAVGSVATSYEDTAKSAKAAAKAQKGFLAGFDEINSVPDKTSSAGGEADAEDMDAGGIGGGGSVIPEVPDVSPQLEKMAESAERMGKKVRDAFIYIKRQVVENKELIIASLAGIAAGFVAYTLAVKGATWATAAFNKMTKAVSALRSAFMFLTTPIGLVILAIVAVVAALVYLYQVSESFRNIVNGVFVAIKDFFIDLWKNVLVPIGLFLAGEFLEAWRKIVEVAQWLWLNIFVPLGKFLMSFHKNVISPLAALISDVLATAFERAAEIAMMFWQKTLQPIVKQIQEKLVPAFDEVSETIQYLWNNAFKPLANFIGNIVIFHFSALIKILEFLWKNVLKPFSKFVWESIKPAFEAVFEAIGGFFTGFIDSMSGLIDFITGVFTGNWEKAWNGVKDIFGGVFKSLWSLAKTPLNLLVKNMNKLIGGLNEIGIELPGWLGGGKFKFNIPKIPELARGGIVNSPTLAMIGEAGPEMVVPLENTSFVDKLASAVGTAVLTAQNFGGGMNQNGGDIVIQIDGNAIAKAIQPYTAKEQTRVGQSMLTII